MPIVEMPDGTKVDFGDLPDEQIRSLIASKFPEDVSAPSVDKTTAGQAFGLGLSGAIPFGGKISSGLAAGALSPFLKQGDESIPGAYKRLYGEAQEFQKSAEEEHPVASLAGTVAGVGSTLPLASSRVLTGARPTQGIRGAINVIPEQLSKIGSFVGSGKVAKDASTAAKAGSLALRSGKGAVVAAPVAGLYEMGVSETGDPLGDIERGARIGAAFGAGGPVVGAGAGALGRGVKGLLPKADEALKPIMATARKFNIPLSIDEVSSGRAIKTAQKVSQEIPFSGQEAFRDKQMRSFNKALAKTMGIDGDKFSRVKIDEAFINVGNKFDKLTKGKTFNVTDDALDVLSSIQEGVSGGTYGEQGAKLFKRYSDDVFARIKNNTLDGDSLVALRNKFARISRTGSNVDAQTLAKDMENFLVDIIGEDAPTALREAKHLYKNLIVVEPLLAKTKAGNINVSELTNRVSKVYGRQFTRGKAGDIGELADVARELLSVPGGSDTFQKSALLASVIGGAIEPVTLLASGGVMGINRAIQSGINRNQAIINAMTKEARDELMALPPSQVQKALDAISTRLGIISTMEKQQ